MISFSSGETFPKDQMNSPGFIFHLWPSLTVSYMFGGFFIQLSWLFYFISICYAPDGKKEN